MDEEERLRARIVVGLDALPVPRAPGLRLGSAAPRGFADFSAAVAVGAAVLLVVLLAVQVALPDRRPASQPAGAEFRDDFSAGIDRTRWTSATMGVGPTVAWNGRVELNIPATAAESPAGAGISAALWAQRCVARGDYVVSVDYELLDWPPRHGTELVLHEVSPLSAGMNAAIQRYQDGDAETILGFGQTAAFSTAVEGTTGSLRLARRGTTVTASYREGNGLWKDLPVEIRSLTDATFQIWLTTDQFVFTGQAVRVAVDNFSLTAAELTCG